MRRTIIATIFQLLAVAAIILSLKPRLDLYFYEHDPRFRFDASPHVYWNYFIIRSWLIALIGIGTGLVLLWSSGLINPKRVVSLDKTAPSRFSGGRLAAIISSVIAVILLCAYLPGLSGIFGRDALDYDVPMECPPRPASGMVFLFMTNELNPPQIEFSPSENASNFLHPTNATKPSN
jgi:hypothetical protein